ncbi:hypothetical protein [Intrasporangium mesophilum]
MKTLNIPESTWDDLHTYLDWPSERMAFLAAVPTAAGMWAVVDVMYLDDEKDYEYQGSTGVELADDVRPRALKWATMHGAGLVEIHSHGVGRLPTTFSTTDLRGLADGAPRLVWRLGGHPYAAIVVGGRKDHDSLAWASKDAAPSSIGQLVIGEHTLTPTGVAVGRVTHVEELA